MKVVGVESNGALIFEIIHPYAGTSEKVGDRYTTGETIDDYGVISLSPEELEILGIDRCPDCLGLRRTKAPYEVVVCVTCKGKGYLRRKE